MRYLITLLTINSIALLCQASEVDFINTHFSISNNKLQYDGPSSKLGKSTVEGNADTYWSKDTDPDSEDFFYASLLKNNGTAVRSFEFTKGQSGLRSGTIKFDNNGQPLAFTGCDIWSGCVTITKRFCDSILRVNGKNAKQVKECSEVLNEILFTSSFSSPTYQNLAASEYKEIEEYRKTNNLVGKNENSWGAWAQRAFATDKGRVIVNNLKQNMSKEIGNHQWDYRNAIAGLARAYQLCEDHGTNLVLGPEENDPDLKTITFELKNEKKVESSR